MVIKKITATRFSIGDKMFRGILLKTDFGNIECNVLEKKSIGKFANKSSKELYEILAGLIERLKEDDTPDERILIESLGEAIIIELTTRFKNLNRFITWRDRLLHHLIDKLEWLKKNT